MRLSILALAFIAPAVLAASPDDGGKARAFSHTLKPGGVAEECLRLDSPTLGLFRTPNTDTEVRGVTIPRDAKTMVLYAAVGGYDRPTLAGGSS